MVKKDLPSIIWNKRAATNLQKAYEYIKEDSPANTRKDHRCCASALKNKRMWNILRSVTSFLWKM